MHAEKEPILVTGAAGFIGSHLSEALLDRGHRVVGADNLDSFYDPAIKRRNLAEIAAHRHARNFHLHETDIRDAAAIRTVFETEQPAGVIHIAAKAGVRPSIEDPAGYALTNVVGTSNVLSAAAAVGCSRIVIASSSSVYGNNASVPFSENDRVDEPISPYAATKRACELLAHTHHHLTGAPTACLRFFTVYGPRQRPDLAVSKFLGLISRDRTVPLFGDGSTSRDYTFIADIVAGILSAYDRIPEHGWRIWNLGGSEPVLLSEMIDVIARVVGREPRIEHHPKQPGDVERTYADLTRASAELGFRPSTDFLEGVARQWAWMQQTALGDKTHRSAASRAATNRPRQRS